MTLPLQFPDPLVEARRRAEEFQHLTNEERIRLMLDTIETGFFLIRESPNRQATQKLSQDREADWQRVQTELFRKHVR
jgi:hypothetical protein